MGGSTNALEDWRAAMNESDVVERMLGLLSLSQPNEHGVAMHGAWSQYRQDYFHLFREMREIGLNVSEDRLGDLMLARDTQFLSRSRQVRDRWQNEVRLAWAEWRFVWDQLRPA